MAIDLVCGHCQGQLIAEQPGSVVACPHCGTHLQVPGETIEEPVAATEPPRRTGKIVTSSLEAVEASLLADSPPVERPVRMNRGLAIEDAVSATNGAPSFSPTAIPATKPSQLSTGEEATAATVSRSLFLMVASYASALTLAFVFLLMQFFQMKSHQLESLPDVVPEVRNGEVALIIVPPHAHVAPDHVLRVGKSRRYGSLKVTPLRVTQGPLHFEHALNDPAAQRSPSEPVLKLWLRFENVSRDQRFSPLDSLLLFKRHYQGLGEPDLTNQFLSRAEERRADGNLHCVFELSPTSEFRIAGQQLDRVLGPGESLETFVPSDEQLDDLTGELVWRVQFRKGYHPQTRHGVTTLIDVPFHRDDVKTES